MVNATRVAAGPKVRALASQRGYADWLVARLVRTLEGTDITPLRFLDGLGKVPPRYVRANPLRSDREDARKRLEAYGFELHNTPLDDQMLRIGYYPVSPGATYEHMAGMTTPQDLASSSAPLALDARPGDVVADLAAAPGIKTLHLAGAMEDRGAIVACEPDDDRLRALRFNLERCGVSNTVLHHGPAQTLPGEADEPWADKVLLDAPCTGEGTIPKDRRRRKGRIEEVTALSGLQEELMDTADRILKPGGTLVYATCTFGPEENEWQVQRLLDRGYRMEALPFDSCGAPLLPGLTQWPGLELSDDVQKARRFLPGIHPTLGFFVAKLTKTDEAHEHAVARAEAEA